MVAAAVRRRILRFAIDQPVHLGPSLSVADILVTVCEAMGPAPRSPADPGRDRLILSKGHAVWALYAVLAERGVLDLEGHRGPLPGHPHEETDGVEVSTGSLGHGLSVAAGLAEAGRLDGHQGIVHVVLGDGELNEGSVWEAVMFAAHRRLGRLVALVDANGMQQEGRTADVLDLSPLADKWRAFGWHTAEVDGHDHQALARALADARAQQHRPSVILCHTIKGKGVPFMEHRAEWHVGRLSTEQLTEALAAVGAAADNGVED